MAVWSFPLTLPLHVLLWIILAVALVISVATDLLRRRILDLVTFPAAVAALGVRFWREGLGDTERGVLTGLLSAAAAAAPFALLAWKGQRFGWGDAKLMAAVGAAFGYPLVLAALVFVSLAGAAQAVVTLLWEGETLGTLKAMAQKALAPLRRRAPALPAAGRHIPYGVAIALGSFWTMWWQTQASAGH